MSQTRSFFKYVSQNILGQLGVSCYILADTFFIAQAAGTDGITMLNLCLPLYNLIFAFGSMLGLGAATRFAILKAQGDQRTHRYFFNALPAAMEMSARYQGDMPITRTVNSIIREGMSPADAVRALMDRNPKDETAAGYKGL